MSNADWWILGVAALALVFSIINISDVSKLRRKVNDNALAQRKAPEGTHEQGRDDSREARVETYVLYGHWHKGEWWNGDTGPDRRWRESYPAPDCRFLNQGIPFKCPKRNPYGNL